MTQRTKHIGYDETKKMLNTLRNLNVNKTFTRTIKEQEEVTPEMSKNLKNDLTVINDVEVKLLSVDNLDMKLTDEQKISISNVIDNFRQQVTNLVDFEPGITVSMDQIRLDGMVNDLDFRFTLVAGKDSGLYIVCNMTEITTELIEMLTKLNKFYQVFVDAMNNLITQRKNN